MRLNAIILFALSLGGIGCSHAPALKEGPVSVSGKLSHGGQPVSNVVVTFHPLDNGHVRSFPVKPDGAFLGELIVGNYSYYVGKLTAPNSEAALKKIDSKYFEPDLGRSISVEPGKEIVLALD